MLPRRTKPFQKLTNSLTFLKKGAGFLSPLCPTVTEFVNTLRKSVRYPATPALPDSLPNPSVYAGSSHTRPLRETRNRRENRKFYFSILARLPNYGTFITPAGPPATEENNVPARHRHSISTFSLNIASGNLPCRAPRHPEDGFSPG